VHPNHRAKEHFVNASGSDEVDIVHAVVEGAAIRVLVAGDGPALVYLHGVGDSGTMLPVLAELASAYRVVRPDHPGFLRSDDGGADSPAAIARVHLALLDQLGIHRFTLVGCSFGGWVASELALLAPGRIDRIILIGPVGLPGDGTAPDIFALTPGELLERTVADPDRRRSMRANPPSEEARALGARNMAALRRVTPAGLQDAGLRQRLAQLTHIDTQLIWGAEDGAVPPSYAEDWAASLGTARLSLIAGAGHLPHVERSADFLRETALLPLVPAS
jgi:pimeloyl-ACP methyl ester carboxylesterase